MGDVVVREYDATERDEDFDIESGMVVSIWISNKEGSG